jgi:hypothetical protein
VKPIKRHYEQIVLSKGCNSKLRAALFIGHRYWPLCIIEGIKHISDFLIREGPRSFELHPVQHSFFRNLMEARSKDMIRQ